MKSLLLAAVLLASTAVSAVACPDEMLLKNIEARHPQGQFIPMDASMFATAKAAYAAHDSPFKPEVTHIVAAEGKPPGTLVFLMLDSDDCLIGASMPIDLTQFRAIFGTEARAMCDEETSACFGDVASDRAAMLLDIAVNIDNVQDPAAREVLLRAMRLLELGIERVVNPPGERRGPKVVPLRDA